MSRVCNNLDVRVTHDLFEDLYEKISEETITSPSSYFANFPHLPVTDHIFPLTHTKHTRKHTHTHTHTFILLLLK